MGGRGGWNGADCELYEYDELVGDEPRVGLVDVESDFVFECEVSWAV